MKTKNEEQAQEILKLKNKNNKDSSNFSKPSRTNGYKKMITNCKEKSNKKQGGQKWTEPRFLDIGNEVFIWAN